MPPGSKANQVAHRNPTCGLPGVAPSLPAATIATEVCNFKVTPTKGAHRAVNRDGTRLRPYLTPLVRPQELAREAGCSHQYVSAVLAGNTPASDRLLEAARRLGLPVDRLYGERQSDAAAA